MYRIDNSTAVPNSSGVPTPSGAGTNVNGYFTSGNPGTNTPATIVDSDWANAIQEEISAVIEGAGLTLSKTTRNQMYQAINGGALGGHGQCRLSLNGATALILNPYNGRRIVINGSGYQIPQGGVIGTNSGLAPFTLYFVYIYNNGGTLALEFSTTNHATDTTAGNYGIEIKAGDSTRTLVGMAYTTSGTQFLDNPVSRNVSNWFNRRSLPIAGNIVSANITSTTYVGIGTNGNTEMCIWPTEGYYASVSGTYSNTTSGASGALAIGQDGTAIGTPTTSTSTTVGQQQSLSAFAGGSPQQGHHVLSPQGFVTTGTGTYTCAIYGYIFG